MIEKIITIWAKVEGYPELADMLNGKTTIKKYLLEKLKSEEDFVRDWEKKYAHDKEQYPDTAEYEKTQIGHANDKIKVIKEQLKQLP
jgi:hypothetical protein